jgi:hypothetical protein
MSTIPVGAGGVGLFILVIVLSGIWLGQSGKPYGTLLFTIHKLAGLATGVWLAVIVYQTHQTAPLSLLEIAAVAVTVLFFVGTVAAGGLLSIDNPMPAVVSTLHRVLPALAVLSTAGTLYLLLGGR